jgi:hypothetical protein
MTPFPDLTPEQKELWNRVTNPITGRPMHYRLLGQSTQPASLGDWATSFENEDRRVRKTQIGPFEVSTVFLGLDHDFSGLGPPVLFETMTFLRGEGAVDVEGMNDEDGRSSKWAEAEAMHQKAVDWIVNNYAAPGEEPVEVTGDEASTARK